jgi:hypothetical protein
MFPCRHRRDPPKSISEAAAKIKELTGIARRETHCIFFGRGTFCMDFCHIAGADYTLDPCFLEQGISADMFLFPEVVILKNIYLSMCN